MSYTQSLTMQAPVMVEPSAGRGGPDLAVRLICPDCKDDFPNIVESFASGDLVCGSCGMVLGDRIVDTRSEWRTFANEEGDDPSRVGATANPLLDGMEQLDTTIGFRDGNSGVARELQRAAAKSTGAKAERNLLTAFRDISNMCESIGLPRAIADTAKQLYKRTDEEKLLRGKSTDAILASCIFISCRQANVPRSFKEICQLTRVPKKQIGQCFKVLQQAFNLTNLGNPGGSSTTSGTSTPATGGAASVSGLAPNGASTGTSAEDLLTRYCNYLGLSQLVQTTCRDVVLNAREYSVAQGRSPVSIAGGAILFTTLLLGQSKPVKEISSVAGVSESTIKLVYRLFYNDREKLVSQKLIDDGKADLSRLTTTDAVAKASREAEKNAAKDAKGTATETEKSA